MPTLTSIEWDGMDNDAKRTKRKETNEVTAKQRLALFDAIDRTLLMLMERRTLGRMKLFCEVKELSNYAEHCALLERTESDGRIKRLRAQAMIESMLVSHGMPEDEAIARTDIALRRK
jgi:hypothetical protein